MKNVLIINGHPDKESYCFALSESYKKGVSKSNTACEIINLIDLDFNPILEYGYRKRTELEPDLIDSWKKIKKADHLVFVFPIWWGTLPALLKGFIDRLFLPKMAFSYIEHSISWDKLLKGKSARLITTMDAPKWYYKLIYRSPAHNAMKKATLEFCGIKPVKISSFTPLKNSSIHTREKWLSEVENLGRKII